MVLRIPVGNQFALIDDEDYDLVVERTWHLCRAKRGKTYYAKTRTLKSDNSQLKAFYMHRLILRNPKGSIDHRNGNGLDNRKSNLRLASPPQNNANMPKRNGRYASIYKGVSFNKQGAAKPWRARLRISPKTFELGYFASEVEAAHAYDEAAIQYFGEFAHLNFADSPREGKD